MKKVVGSSWRKNPKIPGLQWTASSSIAKSREKRAQIQGGLLE